MVCVLQILRKKGASRFDYGSVGINGVSVNGKPSFDSFNSNPTNNPTGPWRAYSSTTATANTTVVVLNGTLDLG